MNPLDLIKEITATYHKHGWKLQRILLCPATRANLKESGELPNEAQLVDADFDALWFARSSHGGREAWELRLLAEQPYALFEAFEADENEEQRQEVRVEMENRVREFAMK